MSQPAGPSSSPALDPLRAKPLVSLVVAAYNEAPIIRDNLETLCRFMQALEADYRWELIVVNDGSSDRTGEIADAFAADRPNVRVLHHHANFGLGQALRYAFANTLGDYVVTLDLDLTYSPDHVSRLLAEIRRTRASVVLASPYMKGGKISNVPWLRRLCSICANRFLWLTTRRRLSTLTGMVRAYDGPFLRTLDLKAMSMDINPEIIYKAMLLRAPIVEIPAHLDWRSRKNAPKRLPTIRMYRQTLSVLLSGFLFRPLMFFVLPGLLLLVASFYVIIWALVHVAGQYARLTQYSWPPSRLSAAVAEAYLQSPHTFVIGGLCLMLAIELIGLGILSLQNKRYFEESFHLNTTIYRYLRQRDGKL